MLYRTLPAAAARDGMLRPSGPLKKSGKIVTTLILSATLFVAAGSVHKPERVVDDDRSGFDVRPDNDFRTIRDHHTSGRSFDVEHESLRQLVERRHGSKLLAGWSHRFHSDEVVEVDLIVLKRRQLTEWCQHVTPAPELCAVAVLQLLELDDEALLERLGAGDRKRRNLFHSLDVVDDCQIAGRRARKNTT